MNCSIAPFLTAPGGIEITTMQVQPITPFVQQSQAAVQVILGAQAFYRGLLRFAGAVRSTAVFVFLGLPAIAALWMLLRLIFLRLSRSLQLVVKVSLSSYSQLRREYDALQVNQQRLYQVEHLNAEKLPWWLRGIAAQIRKIGHLNNLRLQAIAKELELLDPKPTPADARLQPLKEADLWQRRNKAYDYLA